MRWCENFIIRPRTLSGTRTQMKADDRYDKFVECWRDLEMWVRWSFKVIENNLPLVWYSNYSSILHQFRVRPIWYLHRVQKKGATDFFAVSFTNIDGFSQFFVHNFARECQSHCRKNLLPHIRYVANIPCESLRHKSNTCHTILALCTCLYRSHLRKPVPVSMKQTKHSRKSEAQNLCSKRPPFTRTHAFKRLRHCAIADGFGDSVQSWCYADTSWNQGLRSTVTIRTTGIQFC